MWGKVNRISRSYLLAIVSAILLELSFPIAGPLPAWRSLFAWFALAPLLVALCCGKLQIKKIFLVGYLCGAAWYLMNCFWVRETMAHYGEMPTLAPTGILILFSLYLGLYFGGFALALGLFLKATGSWKRTLAAAPFLWVTMELAAARVTSFPWDQLGMSQIDNARMTMLAPWTGVYGISCVVLAVNAVLAAALLSNGKQQWRLGCGFVLLFVGLGVSGLWQHAPEAKTTHSAVLIQPNLDVAGDQNWREAGSWNQHLALLMDAGAGSCNDFTRGMPGRGDRSAASSCAGGGSKPEFVAWPESPAPFIEDDPRFRASVREAANQTGSALIIGGIGVEFQPKLQSYMNFNSAMVFAPSGDEVGRYDKIHLVPFGEYIPYKDLFFFAKALTSQVGESTRGRERKLFRLNGHHYGIFICYESVFADEVRHFVQLGAEVLVNISDDGWYGDSSAPWQHLNMARMRAIENHRWILRATNTGVTAAIDPNGHVRQSLDRHIAGRLRAEYGIETGMTFYTVHGDLFAYACAILGMGLLGWSIRRRMGLALHEKVRS